MSTTRPPRPSILRPSTLAPVELDLRKVFLAGMLLWALALAVMIVLEVTGTETGRGPAVSITGVILGVLALVWEHRRNHSRPGR
ncbi:DUF2530 domain-containing protein [Cellulomonas bogoriensis]|uniref:DUF2530 domain-containing protein n=1 Tax=Cellulomonas bogoriensis 69B4 = DSM 16987 TaxID=1386082 RepID=A0A0A0BLI6_9CELL|nr:DUF2530 domain-containing protein [Cellulomonas bogoriensis]KGM08710.1 hypothetical protein N869_04835 [Cellulomonas bogoriensis 69B4 = DSM 16987]